MLAAALTLYAIGRTEELRQVNRRSRRGGARRVDGRSLSARQLPDKGPRVVLSR